MGFYKRRSEHRAPVMAVNMPARVPSEAAVSKPPSKYAIARERIGRLSLGERALLAFSKHPLRVRGGYDGYAEQLDSIAIDPHPLRNLQDRFKYFEAIIYDRRVMDFGCGDGQQTVAIALGGAKSVVGVDINPIRLRRARQFAGNTSNVSFAEKAEGLFDVVISQDAFEHFAEPRAILRELLDHLRPDGTLLITYGPPWLSPYGAHMHFFTTLPWVHLLFPEKTVMRVRSVYRRAKPNDHYTVDLNKMSVGAFLRMIRAESVTVAHLKLYGVKKLNFIGWFPLLREFFVINVSCILIKPWQLNESVHPY